MILKNKRIVITGGTSGVGYQLMRQLHADNEVIIISRDNKKLAMLSQEFEGLTCYQADLSKLKDIENVATKVLNKYVTIDILINNAAIQFTPTFLDKKFTYESISHEIALNFTSICSLSYLLLSALQHDNQATILNINSGLALVPKTTSAIYCATKGALNTFTLSLRYQLEKTNISVQQVFLELVETAMTTGRGENKMSAKNAAKKIIYGIEHDILDHDIGKVKLLRFLLRLAPTLAQKIMKKY